MTLELTDCKFKRLRWWLREYAVWLRETSECVPDYAVADDLKAKKQWKKQDTEVDNFVKNHMEEGK